MELVQKINTVWKNLSLVQKAVLTAVVMAFAIAAIFLTRWAGQPEMRLLYDGLELAEAGRIADKVAEQNIVYELRNGGRSIYVPAENVYRLRLEMAKDGLPSGSQGGYKIFDDEKLGVSPFVQNVNLTRALQDELAKSIEMIEGVSKARIHIVKPENKLFSSDKQNTSASVVVQLASGHKLSNGNIASISHLIAGSVEGLVPENVTVVDSEGNLLSRNDGDMSAGGAGTVQDYRERIEQNMARKAEDMLLAVLGTGRSSVKVSAVVDMNSTNIITESYDPKGIPTKEEIKSESEMSRAGDENTSVPTRKNETVTTEMVVGKTIREQTVLPGRVVSLSVAAFVDLTSQDAEGNETKLMEVAQVEEVLRKALGLDETSELKVVDVRFNRPAVIEAAQAPKFDIISIVRQASLGIMAVCALIVLKIMGGGKKQASLAAGTMSLGAGTESAGLLTSSDSDPLVLRRQIAGALQNNPEKVKQLFASWLEERG